MNEPIPYNEVTWVRILEEEPEVGWVMAEIQGKGKAGWHVFVARHGTTPKNYLCKLVGFDAYNPALRSQEAYRLTMERMWELVL